MENDKSKNQEENEHANEDLLDTPETASLFSRKDETTWGNQPNTLLERHPFLCGYLFLTLLFTLLFATHLFIFTMAFLFLYLISDFLTNDLRRVLRVVPKALLFSLLYIAVVGLLIVFFYKVIPNLVRQLPGFAQQVQTQAIAQFEQANEKWELTRYVDPDEVRQGIIRVSTKALSFFAGKFSALYTGFIYFIFALVINLLLYHDTSKIDVVFARRPNSMAGFLYRFVKLRIQIFYFYFKRVMGGQIIISVVNTVISSIAIFGLDLPRPILLILFVFFFGLFPIVGNIVSNTILTVTALVSIGWVAAVVCLGLLVGIHKLEYFLNSKIIGEIVHLPMVVTLAALIISEVLLGIIGLMLAIPLVLFIRHELEKIPGYREDFKSPPVSLKPVKS